MFPVETLELIQQTALRAADANVLLTPKPTLLLAEGIKLQDIEHLDHGRCRFRGTFATTSVADFIQNVSHRASEPQTPGVRPAVFIDAVPMKAKAFYNLGNVNAPGHGDDTAQLTLVPSALFKAINDINGRAKSQRELAEFIEDWRHAITVIGEHEDTMATAMAVHAIRNITVKEKAETGNSEGHLKATKTRLEQIEAESDVCALPAFIKVYVEQPYTGLAPVDVTLRLSMNGGSDTKPALTLRIVREGELIEAIAQDFKRVLLNGLEDKAALYVGTFTP